MDFSVTILGSGSATPTLYRNPTAQLINISEQYFLIDCAEGTQLQLRKYKLKFNKIDHIFISHLHGDHYLGLVGLISSFHLLGRERELHIYSPEGLEAIVRMQLEASQTFLRYKLIFHAVDTTESEVIFENKLLTVTTIPLRHRIACAGYLFREATKERKLIKECIKEYAIPLAAMPKLKRGEDVTLEDGSVLKSEEVTKAAPLAKSYAFCSDTKFSYDIAKLVQGVNLLYHEATFLEALAARAKTTHHSTAKQAATVAKVAEVGKLLIGHFSARYTRSEEHVKEAKEVFENVVAVNDGDKFVV